MQRIFFFTFACTKTFYKKAFIYSFKEMYPFNKLLDIIEGEIARLRYDSEPVRLYEPIKYILSIGGKRIRPVFTLMACNLYSDKPLKALEAALALETFHNFTLLHDDIMDNSAMRRNQPTVHTKWNSNIAILSGDAMCIKAYEHLAHVDAKYIKPVMDVFTRTALEVCEGQQFDMDFELRDDVSVEEYLKMIELKTSVLIAACFKIGAIMGDAREKDIEMLYEFGKNIGLAFQLQDDLLDVYGDKETFGKNIGGDILCNKKTFLLISAFHQAKGETLSKLRSSLSDKTMVPADKIKEVTKIYDQLHVKEISEKQMKNYFDQAFILLGRINVEPAKTKEIRAVVEKLRKRTK